MMRPISKHQTPSINFQSLEICAPVISNDWKLRSGELAHAFDEAADLVVVADGQQNYVAVVEKKQDAQIETRSQFEIAPERAEAKSAMLVGMAEGFGQFCDDGFDGGLLVFGEPPEGARV